MDALQLVPAGQFIVKVNEHTTLKAVLGTCVGLTLFDEQTGVGGLYHILLPAPYQEGSKSTQKIYASTGLPLFLNGLLEAGAKEENLVATVAGGALLGPVTVQDTRINVGGRTLEVVENFLNSRKIKILEQESGGYLNCTLAMQFPTGECTIESTEVREGNDNNDIKPIKEAELTEAVTRVRPIPQIALKVIQMINSQDTSMSEIGEEIRRDQVLAAKVLSLSNSAYFGLPRRIDTVNQALVYLGEKKTLLLILSVFTETFYQDSGKGYSLSKGGLYHHALGCALTAEKLANISGIMPPDLAYTGGLLHDVGRIVLDQYVARDYPMIYRRLAKLDESMDKIEKDMFGHDHNEVGGRLAELWKLPDSLTEVIRFHHKPHKSKRYPKFTSLIFLADLLVSRFQGNLDLDLPNIDGMQVALHNLNIPIQQLPDIIAQIPWNSFQQN